jgi:hypothetical protein
VPVLRRRVARRVLGAAVAALAACAGCTSSPRGAVTTTTSRPPSTTSPSGFVPNRLDVVGTTLRRSTGGRFVVKGVEVYVIPFYEDSGLPDPDLARVTAAAWAGRDALFARLVALGVNTVRIQISEEVYADDVYGLGGSAGYLARLDGLVEAATSHGLEVIVTWGDPLGLGAALVSRYQPLLAMMAKVASALASNPDVIYEPYNEPNGVSWVQWFALTKTMLTWWRRTIGYRGPLVVDTPVYSWAFDPAWAREVIALDASLDGRADVLIANHRYPNANTCFCGAELAAWGSLVGRYTRQFPIVGTEYGVDDGAGPPEVSWGRQLLAYLAADAVPAGFNGAVAFAFNWVDANAMVDPTTGALTAWGTAVREAFLAADLPG